MNREVSKKVYEYQAELCKALAHPIRLEILDHLAEGELNSTQLLELLQIPKANLSQHLCVLKDAGIIEMRKEGLFQFSRLASPQVKEACSLVRAMLLEKIGREEQQSRSIKSIIQENF